jgi:hypothetical protein
LVSRMVTKQNGRFISELSIIIILLYILQTSIGVKKNIYSKREMLKSSQKGS